MLQFVLETYENGKCMSVKRKHFEEETNSDALKLIIGTLIMGEYDELRKYGIHPLANIELRLTVELP